LSTSALVRPRPQHRAEDLLSAYLPGSFFYSSVRGVLLADGVHATVAGGPGPRADAATRALHAAADAGLAEPVVVGALGFGPDAPASLVVPAVVRRALPAGVPVVPAPRDELSPGGWSVTPRPDPSVYADGVAKALDLIGSGALRKVVLARSLELTAPQPVAVPELLARLARADANAHAFAVDVTAAGDPATRTLVGASPELLVRRRGDLVEAVPLAGSRPRTADPAGLLASDKDRHEHALVVDQVVEVLGRFCSSVVAPPAPEIMGTATMWHLASRITGRLNDPSVGSLALAEALHPTPAVCGVPLAAARAAIAEIEPEDRGYYSGLVGWSDLSGDGEWVVTIRSAEVCGPTVRMFAGAGIVDGSRPDAELAETTAKFRTLLRAIGLELAS
jgi:isochorismate synthase